MPRIPGSQSRDIVHWKREEAQVLLGRGLSVAQVAAQLRCSETLVRRVRSEMQGRAWVTTTIRWETAVRDGMAAIALEHGRSLEGELEWVCRRYLADTADGDISLLARQTSP